MSTGQGYRQRFAVQGGDYADAGEQASTIRTTLKEVGFHPNVVRRAAIAAYEAEMNIIMYSRHGFLEVSVTPEQVTVVAEDEGPGIPDLPLAMTEGFTTATDAMREMGFGAGMGLPNIKRNCDRLTVSSAVGRGARLEMLFDIHDRSVGAGVAQDGDGRPL